ncbi:RNA-binding S4 domain-containing protein [Demequina salsinemoris]|uniref:RNA-binding S4 domain-containing protein n=1 Tax=Demequina salsinemoris TaxID=577470 RepID=UPI00078275F8|nr:RNA-binding S4 domain-containing protein [Demequina salsinemoris]
MTESVRADVWVWAVRLAKTRTQATDACKAGHIRVRGERAKPSTPVRVGDQVIVRGGDRERIVLVTRLLLKRVGAEPAREAYEDHSPPPPKKEHYAPFAVRDRGAGKPTKRERRELDRLRGRR